MNVFTTILVVATFWSVADARTVEMKFRRRVRTRCEKITVPMCKTVLPYTSTEFPNSLDHYNQKMVQRSLEMYRDLVTSNCSESLAFFVCAYHLPVCIEKVPMAIRPCRGVCEKVKRDCAATIRHLNGTGHADSVKCEELPSYATGVCSKQDSFVEKPDVSCKKQPRLKYKVYTQRSYAFVIKLTVKSIAKNNVNTTLVRGNLTRIVKGGRVHLKKAIVSLSFTNAPCLLDLLKENRTYIIAGHEDVPKGKLVVLQNGFIKPGVRKWVLRLQKWERRNKRKSRGKGRR